MRTVNANSKESSPKPNVVRRLFAKDESDIGSDSEQDSFVTNLRHPRNEEYKILEILPTKDGMMKEAGFSQQGLDLSQFIHPNSSEIEDCTFQEGVSLVQKNYPTQITNSQTRDLERAEIFNHKDYPLETGEHAQKGRSFTQDIHSTQPLFSQTGDLAQAEICIDPNNPLEDHTHKETFFAQDIHSTQASISQTGDLIQAETYLHQDNLIPIQVHAQEEISFVHNIHFTQASISQTCDLIQAETYIHQDNLLPIEDHAQEGTSFVNNIHSKQAPIPFKSNFIQSNTFIEPTINHSLTVISRFDDNLEEEEAGKRKVYEDNQQASTSFGSPSSELCLKQPYKKRRLYEHLKEMDICIQQIRDETASTENLNNATIVINIEPEENKNEYEEEIENINTTINKENVKNNRIYKHIDFLSDSDEFVYSSSTGQDSTESNDTDRVNEKKKRLKKKPRKNPKPYHVNVLTFKDFCGWDIVADKYFKGNLTGKISKVRTATFKKAEPQKMTVKYTMATDEAKENIEIIKKNKNLQPKNIYKSRLPISKKKYEDLWKLCTTKIIPENYHQEYANFPNAMNIQDSLQETDVEDNV
ncbi:unnamed protein product [Colias eurytheme]|nr:unnamed protein product [Colias eurytheme]